MKTVLFGVIFLVLLVFAIPAVSCLEEIDTSVLVVKVIEGDTFETETESIIKLADIDPACADIDNSTGYFSAKSILASLVENKTVYLDIDDLHITDQSGTGNKTVAVVYVDYNSTHYRNVNYTMFNQKLLAVNDQDNDFNPNTWTQFVKKHDIPEFPTGALITIFWMGVSSTLTIFFVKSCSKPKY